MEGSYGVLFGSQQIGKVQVQRQGLYYRFICRCQLTGDVVCRLLVTCGEKQENLGVVVPVDGGFGLDTRLAVKKIGEGKMEFLLVPRHETVEKTGTFCPIYPEEPFAYIARLKDAFFARQNGQAGVILK